MGRANEGGQAWPWCPVKFRDEGASVARFKSEREILEAARAGVSDAETPALLTAGFLKGLLSLAGEVRLTELLDASDMARQEARAAARFKYAHGGLSREAVAAMEVSDETAA